jgi:hypothetical protein
MWTLCPHNPPNLERGTRRGQFCLPPNERRRLLARFTSIMAEGAVLPDIAFEPVSSNRSLLWTRRDEGDAGDAIDRVSSQIYLGCMSGSPPAEPGGIMISVLPSSGVLAFIPGSTSEGQSTPFDWPSSSPSVWLLRSCWEHAFASVVWADADDIIARVIATGAASIAVLLFVIWGQPPPERAVP